MYTSTRQSMRLQKLLATPHLAVESVDAVHGPMTAYPTVNAVLLIEGWMYL